MSDNNSTKPKKSFSADWLVGGILTRIGETFDRFTGRNWKPSSNLATSELIERLKSLLDSETKDLGEKGRFVPHNIKLKMQWNKFSTDSEDGLKKLEYEMLAAAIDHINDNRYHTYKPLKIEIKPDYFTEGVKFLASFGEFDEEKEAEVNISVPQMKVENLIPEAVNVEPEGEIYIAEFTVNDKQKSVELNFKPGKRLGVGRNKENDLSIEDASVSKIHAALILNNQNKLVVADTGSTNGTFINGERIAYGRAFPVGETDKLKFGTIDIHLRAVPKQTDFETSQSYQTENFQTENIQAIQDYQAVQNMPTMQDFSINQNSPIDNKEKSTEIYPSSENISSATENISTPIVSNPVNKPVSLANNTISSGETTPSIPMPQPKDTFQTNEDFKMSVYPKNEQHELKDSEHEKNIENQSEVFSTEPRIKLNFGDDEEK